MWRRKKLVVVAVLATAALAGSIGGAVIAADNGEDGNPEAALGTLLDRVCAIYEENTGTTIDSQALKDAFVQAQSEMRTEVLQNRLQYLVEQGQITDEQAGQYLEWWQSKPDAPVKFGFKGHGRLGGYCPPYVTGE